MNKLLCLILMSANFAFCANLPPCLILFYQRFDRGHILKRFKWDELRILLREADEIQKISHAIGQRDLELIEESINAYGNPNNPSIKALKNDWSGAPATLFVISQAIWSEIQGLEKEYLEMAKVIAKEKGAYAIYAQNAPYPEEVGKIDDRDLIFLDDRYDITSEVIQRLTKGKK